MGCVEGGLMVVMSFLESVHHPWVAVEGGLMVVMSFLESVHHPWVGVEGVDGCNVLLGECGLLLRMF